MYDFINHNDDILLLDVDYVNDPHVIGQNDNLISINNYPFHRSFGQANSESMGTQQFSGTGDRNFVRGAQISRASKPFSP
jgi:4-hydroxybutyrate CoA-transferase